jgi:hypothetical protein
MGKAGGEARVQGDRGNRDARFSVSPLGNWSLTKWFWDLLRRGV